MLDQIIIGEKASLDDFGASLAKRYISTPAKKEIKETVPFSNNTYDFSAINGEVYWEEREIKYVFEILAESPEELERKKTAFSGWIMNVMNQNIYDPFEPDYHYVGTFDSLDYDDDDSVEKTTATATFMVYPYKIANTESLNVITVPIGTEKEVTITNNSAHRITPFIISDTPVEIKQGAVTYTFSAGITSDDRFKMYAGDNLFVIKNIGENEELQTVRIMFLEEVF